MTSWEHPHLLQNNLIALMPNKEETPLNQCLNLSNNARFCVIQIVLINPVLFLSRRSHRLGGGVLGATGALGGAVAEAVAELAGDELQ